MSKKIKLSKRFHKAMYLITDLTAFEKKIIINMTVNNLTDDCGVFIRDIIDMIWKSIPQTRNTARYKDSIGYEETPAQWILNDNLSESEKA